LGLNTNFNEWRHRLWLNLYRVKIDDPPRLLQILAIDDSLQVLTAVKELLGEVAGPIRVDSATSAEAGLALLTREHYDVILLDLVMPGMDGIAALKEIMRLRPEQRVLIMSGHSALSYSNAVKRLGARGYLQKEWIPTRLMEAIRALLDGGEYWCADDGPTVSR